LRRVARRRSDLFVRLGRHQEALYLLAPTDLPIAFLLSPRGGADGSVRVVAADAEADAVARGSILALLGVFDGSMDADSTMFSRGLVIEGDTAALVALHNALEAGAMTLADLAGLPAPLSRPANAAFRAAQEFHRAMSAA
jgi:predicted lipid carrier protein YhbT